MIFFAESTPGKHLLYIKKVKVKQVTNRVYFQTEDGEQIGEPKEVSGKVGEKLEVTLDGLPKGFEFSEGNSIELSETDTSHTLKVKDTFITNELEFFTPNDKSFNTPFGVKNKKIRAKNGTKFALDKDYLPYGYEFYGKSEITVSENQTAPHKVYVTPKHGNMKIQIIDKYTNKVVGEKTINNVVFGEGYRLTLRDIPNGYIFDTNSSYSEQEGTVFWMGDEFSKIHVNKISHGISTLLENAFTSYKTVTVDTTKNNAQLYNSKGKISNRSLKNGSQWRTDKIGTLNGEAYYRVSTDEWIKAKDVYEYEEVWQQESIIHTKKGKLCDLYDLNGQVINNRRLAAGSAWFTDRTKLINGRIHYRVSTNEWISLDDIQENI